MNDWNWVSVAIVVALFLMWKLDFVATLLNLRAFPPRVPDELEDLMNDESLQRARDYHIANARVDIIQSIFMLCALLGFWFAGGFAWMDEWAGEYALGRITQGLLFLGGILFAQSLASFPFSAWHTFVIENRFGFNRATLGTFLGDRLKGMALALILGAPLTAAVLWIFYHVEHAWLWAWALFTLFQVVLTWLAPTYIMPLFNRFSPMPDGELKQRIEQLGRQCGFPLEGVSVMDGSRRSTKANAFFTGLGKRKKIALFDTLIEKSSIPELLAVLAHEIGHFRCGHIKQRLFAGVVQTAAMFYLLGLCTDPTGPLARGIFDAFGVAEISPHVGIVAFAILFEPCARLLGVAMNAWSRKHEFEADAYAVKAVGEANSLGDALRKMSSDHLSHPAPSALRVWLDYSHPPLLQRLRAMRAVNLGQ